MICSLEDSGGMRESLAGRIAADRCEIAESSPDLTIWRFPRSFREGFPSATGSITTFTGVDRQRPTQGDWIDPHTQPVCHVLYSSTLPNRENYPLK